MLQDQQEEINALLAQRVDAERRALQDAEERAIAHQDAMRAARSEGIAQCNALAKEVDDRVQALEQRLASVHAQNMLAADQLGVKAQKLAEKDADNNALAQQLKRTIAKQRETLMANKERWAAAEKALRDEYAKLKDDHTRSLTQFQQLDAKHAVLETADARRRAAVALTDAELLDELGTSCVAIAAELQQLADVAIDGMCLDSGLLNDLAVVINELVAADETADASRALHMLDTLNAAVNSQRAVLEERQAIVTEISALRSGRSSALARGASVK